MGMGVYTSIMTEALKHQAGTRAMRSRHVPDRGADPEEAAPFVCRQCGDGYDHEGECPRCDVALARRDHTVQLDAPELVPTRSPITSLLALALAIGFPGIVLGSFLWLRASTSGPGPEAFAAAIVGFGALAVMTFGWAWHRFDPNRKERLAHEAALRRAKRRQRTVPLVRVEDLPAKIDGAVRVRGRVRVELGDDGEPHLTIVDGDGCARVRLHDRLRVWDQRGARGALSEGEQVEVVGRGRRVIGAGNGYRDEEGDFAFEEDVEVTVLATPRTASARKPEPRGD
jgi:hypothetical protein